MSLGSPSAAKTSRKRNRGVACPKTPETNIKSEHSSSGGSIPAVLPEKKRKFKKLSRLIMMVHDEETKNSVAVGMLVVMIVVKVVLAVERKELIGKIQGDGVGSGCFK